MKDLLERTREELAGWPQELIPGNLEELIERLYDTDNRKAVSYTHLDVYKRQGYTYPRYTALVK